MRQDVGADGKIVEMSEKCCRFSMKFRQEMQGDENSLGKIRQLGRVLPNLGGKSRSSWLIPSSQGRPHQRRGAGTVGSQH